MTTTAAHPPVRTGLVAASTILTSMTPPPERGGSRGTQVRGAQVRLLAAVSRSRPCGLHQGVGPEPDPPVGASLTSNLCGPHLAAGKRPSQYGPHHAAGRKQSWYGLYLGAGRKQSRYGLYLGAGRTMSWYGPHLETAPRKTLCDLHRGVDRRPSQRGMHPEAARGRMNR